MTEVLSTGPVSAMQGWTLLVARSITEGLLLGVGTDTR